ncbi:OsmC family protein [Uliginosibacterium sp. H3]|uniref:OsmC family protein n=1 Tax=Uliginosibacterium silvisoli TaxID=3114758 RepID=A0ABU6K5F7_9RHOO|nr:OsmC family protein [Uliginosibacterium sp. H3]
MSTLHLTKDTTTADGMRQKIDLAGFTIHTDVSIAAGGSGSAPGPHDLFDASLAACKALTLTLYARRKGWPLDHVDVSLTSDASAEREGKYKLDVALTLHGNLDETQRTQLLAVADKCPIHKLMTTATIEVSTRLADEAA